MGCLLRPSMIERNSPKYEGERRDCTIRALATVTGVEYCILAEFFRTQGKRRNCGFPLRDWLKNNPRAFGYYFEQVDWPERTGRFLLFVSGHVWAYVDGKHYDTWNATSKRIKAVFKATPCELDDKTREAMRRDQFLKTL